MWKEYGVVRFTHIFSLLIFAAVVAACSGSSNPAAPPMRDSRPAVKVRRDASGSSGPQFAQSCNSSGSDSCTFLSTPASGHLLVAIAAAEYYPLSCASGWTEIGSVTASYDYEIACYDESNGNSATVTPLSGTATNYDLKVWDVSGTSLAVDTYSGAEGGSGGSQTLTIAPSDGNDFIATAAFQSGVGTTSVTVPVGYTTDQTCSSACISGAGVRADGSAYLAGAGSGSQSLTWAFNGSTRVSSAFAVAVSGQASPTPSPPPNGSAPQFAQFCSSSGSDSCSFASAPASGHLLVAAAAAEYYPLSCGSGWTQIGSVTASYDYEVACYDFSNGSSSTVTPLSGTATNYDLKVWDVGGTSLSIDSYSGAEGGSSGSQTLTIAPSGSNDLIATAAFQSGTGTTSVTVPTGYTVNQTCISACISGSGVRADGSAYFSGAGTGSQSLTWAFNGSTRVSSAIAVAINSRPTPAPTPTLPPMGVYNSCEIDTNLGPGTGTCEAYDSAMVQAGFSWEVNYIGMMATKTSLQAWFTYDASIGLGQVLVIDNAVHDPVDPLLGNSLLNFNGDSNLASSCGATTNEALISCVNSVASSIPGFHYMWYLYDEPGCPNQSIGYCQGTLAGGDYNNIQTLANYIHSIDPTNGMFGVNVGDCCVTPASAQQAVAGNLYSWLAAPPASAIGYDYYPIPEGTASPGSSGYVGNVGTDALNLANIIKTDDSAMGMIYVSQAFSWYQEGGNYGCSSMAACPYPTETQMQELRDNALYYANQSGVPITMMLWYEWPAIDCLSGYTPCSAQSNLQAVSAAMSAPFPATPPPSN